MHIVFQYIWMQANRISQQEDPFFTPRRIPSFDWLYSIDAGSKFLFDRSIIPQHTLFSLFLAVSHYPEVFSCAYSFPFNNSRCFCCFLLSPIILKYFRVHIFFHLTTRVFLFLRCIPRSIPGYRWMLRHVYGPRVFLTAEGRFEGGCSSEQRLSVSKPKGVWRSLSEIHRAMLVMDAYCAVVI